MLTGCIRQPAVAASSLDQEFHGYQWAALDPGLQISIAAEFLMHSGDDLAAASLIQNGSRSGGQVGSYALLEVEGACGVRQQVGIPVAASRATASPEDRFGVISGMIETVENLADRHTISREEQDAYALRRV